MPAPLEHGHTRYQGRKRMSPTYMTWIGMKRRCTQEDHHNWEFYGGRGITYDPRWEDFACFLEDMGERPEGTTLDRIDPDGPYCKDNCRWVDSKAQVRNRRNTVRVEFQGQTIALQDLAERVGIPYQTLWSRIKKYGWDVDKAATTPVDPRFRPKK